MTSLLCCGIATCKDDAFRLLGKEGRRAQSAASLSQGWLRGKTLTHESFQVTAHSIHSYVIAKFC